MKKTHLYFAVLCLSAAFVAVGCAQKPESADSKQAISNAQKLQDVKAQADYLIKEANAFLNSQQFDQAVNTAKYVLANLDKESQQAKSIIEQAQVKLKAMAQQKVDEAAGDVKKALGGLGQ